MAAPDNLNPTVHIVDDDEDFREGLAWLLDSRGLPVRCWSGGDSLLQALRVEGAAWSCCVVLLDIRMEPLSGLATFEQLRTMGWPWPDSRASSCSMASPGSRSSRASPPGLSTWKSRGS